MRGRRITALVATGLLALAAAGCGGGEELAPQVPGPPAEVKVPQAAQAPGGRRRGGAGRDRRQQHEHRLDDRYRQLRQLERGRHGDARRRPRAPIRAAGPRRRTRRRTARRTTRRRRTARTPSNSRTSAPRIPAPADFRTFVQIGRKRPSIRSRRRSGPPISLGDPKWSRKANAVLDSTSRTGADGALTPLHRVARAATTARTSVELCAELIGALHEAFAVDQVHLFEVAQDRTSGEATTASGGEDYGMALAVRAVGRRHRGRHRHDACTSRTRAARG